MFQDLNRKLQHAAEKEKEVPGADSKVRSTGSAPVTFPGLAVPSQMCKGQGRRILSLALSGRFQSVLPHSTDPTPSWKLQLLPGFGLWDAWVAVLSGNPFLRALLSLPPLLRLHRWP